MKSRAMPIPEPIFLLRPSPRNSRVAADLGVLAECTKATEQCQVVSFYGNAKAVLRMFVTHIVPRLLRLKPEEFNPIQ